MTMLKRYVVKYDDLGKPIEIVEIKEFTDSNVLRQFREKCEENKVKYLERQKEAAEREKQEKELKEREVAKLKQDIFVLKDLVKYLLGYVELEDMNVYKSYLGVDSDETEN